MSDSSRGDGTTDFGYERVAITDKERRVGQVFASVAPRYDVMNDLMSFGLHRVWKRFAIEMIAPRPGQRILDVAAGTGDLTKRLARAVGEGGLVVASDINAPMLTEGRRRLVDAGWVRPITYVQASAEALPFASDSFDSVSIAFGLRNVTHRDRALAEMFRLLRPGGKLVVLEFSKLRIDALRPLYDAYSLHVLPRIGQIVARDAGSYRYLAESIRMFPDQFELKNMLHAAGFEGVDVFNLTAGVVAVHRGFKC